MMITLVTVGIEPPRSEKQIKYHKKILKDVDENHFENFETFGFYVI